jgi:hypothetical protein
MLPGCGSNIGCLSDAWVQVVDGYNVVKVSNAIMAGKSAA